MDLFGSAEGAASEIRHYRKTKKAEEDAKKEAEAKVKEEQELKERSKKEGLI